MDRPAPPKAPAPPSPLTPPTPEQVNEALRALREKYRAAIAKTVAGFRYLAAQLTVKPENAEVLDSLRRELHRVHGAAGSFGFPDASRLAGVLEERAVRWAGDPAADRGTRGAIIAHFAGALEAHVLGMAAPPTPAASALRPAATDPQSASTQPARAAANADHPEGSTPQPAARSRVPDVIVVEDDPALTEMLRYALHATGYSFEHYGTGPEALTALLALETGDQRPVVLLDVDLPGLDGFSLYERLNARRRGAFAVVFFTVHSAEADQLRAYRGGVIDYVTKPVNLRVLMAKIPSWLARGGRSAR